MEYRSSACGSAGEAAAEVVRNITAGSASERTNRRKGNTCGIIDDFFDSLLVADQYNGCSGLVSFIFYFKIFYFSLSRHTDKVEKVVGPLVRRAIDR
jgi:hypothetical protein